MYLSIYLSTHVHIHLAVGHALGAADSDLLVEQESVRVEVRVLERAADALDDLDLVQVSRAAKLNKHRV